MTKNTIAVLGGAALALQFTFGCARKDRTDPAPRADGQVDRAKRADSGGETGAAAENEKNAQEVLREAEEAERQGQFSLAMNHYERLRSFPEASRPKDLDQRMAALRQKMSAEGGGGPGSAPGPTTLPVEPR
jgi:hypothetical protein